MTKTVIRDSIMNPPNTNPRFTRSYPPRIARVAIALFKMMESGDVTWDEMNGMADCLMPQVRRVLDAMMSFEC